MGQSTFPTEFTKFAPRPMREHHNKEATLLVMMSSPCRCPWTEIF